MKNMSNGRRGNYSEALDESRSPIRQNAFEPLLDSKEAAALLKIHAKTLQRMARKGEIPAMQIGKLWRFSASALLSWEQEKLAG